MAGLSQFRRSRFTSYTTRDGLPDSYMTVVFQDGNGTIWTGSSKGLAAPDRGWLLGRCRRAAVSRMCSSRRWPRIVTGGFGSGRTMVCSDRHGPCAVPRTRCDAQFVRLRDSRRAPRDLSGSRRHHLGRRRTTKGCSTYRGDIVRAYTTADGLAHNAVRAIEEDREGALWIGTRGGGISRLKNGAFTTLTMKDGLASNSIQGALRGP